MMHHTAATGPDTPLPQPPGDYTPDSLIPLLGQHTRIALRTVLRVMQALLWVETRCASTESKWSRFKHGLAENLHREKIARRSQSVAPGTVRFGKVFGGETAFDVAIRAGLHQAAIGTDATGTPDDTATAQIMQAAIRFHCGGGCQNIGYVDLPLHNDDILAMCRQMAATHGPEMRVGLWNPSYQGGLVHGILDTARQDRGTVALGTYIEVWGKLRAALQTGQETRHQILKSLGGTARQPFFAQFGIDMHESGHERVVLAALRKFCPPKRGQCNARIRFAHAIRPAHFVQGMLRTLQLPVFFASVLSPAQG